MTKASNTRKKKLLQAKAVRTYAQGINLRLSPVQVDGEETITITMYGHRGQVTSWVNLKAKDLITQIEKLLEVKDVPDSVRSVEERDTLSGGVAGVSSAPGS